MRPTESIKRLIPTTKANLINTALPLAEENLLQNDIFALDTSYLRIYACMSIPGKLRVARTVGETTVTEDLNGSNALTPDAAYMFSVDIQPGDKINFKYSTTGGTIKTLRVNEIGGAE